VLAAMLGGHAQPFLFHFVKREEVLYRRWVGCCWYWWVGSMLYDESELSVMVGLSYFCLTLVTQPLPSSEIP
jgi:hypothetical protein